MASPLVSVLIPCYNAEKYVGETLESVFCQTWPDIEVIVVDDGSTDNSVAEVNRFRFNSLTVMSQRNAGPGAARNRAFRASRGDFIQYLDADDLIAPDKIERQIARLLEEPGAVASAEWGRFYLNPVETRFEPEPVWCDLAPIEWLILSRQAGLGMLFPALWLVPRSIADMAGPWDESLTLGDDGEYFTRVLLHSSKILFCPSARCYYRSGLENSVSGSRAWESQFRVIARCEEHIRAREDSERVRRGFALSWQHLAHAAHPYCPNLAESALARARSLHAARIRPAGGTAFRVVSRLLGWRAARRLQVACGRS